MSTMTMRIAHPTAGSLVLCAVVAGCGDRKSPATPPERQFATAEEAAAALVAAAEQFNVPELKAILGPDGEVLVSSADTVADRNHAIGLRGGSARAAAAGIRLREDVRRHLGRRRGLADADPDRQAGRQVVLRCAGGEGRDSPPAHRAE